MDYVTFGIVKGGPEIKIAILVKLFWIYLHGYLDWMTEKKMLQSLHFVNIPTFLFIVYRNMNQYI